jgi:hypothetical protein
MPKCLKFSDETKINQPFLFDVMQKNKHLATNEKSLNVDWNYADSVILEKKFRGRHKSYIISTCCASDKFSTDYINCIGIILMGISKKNNDALSVLAHLNPYTLNYFLEDFIDSIHEFKENTQKRNRIAGIFGGNYLASDPIFRTNYLAVIRSTSDLINQEMQIDPTVLMGPKLSPKNKTNFYLFTQERRAIITQNFIHLKACFSFPASRLNEAIKNWE